MSDFNVPISFKNIINTIIVLEKDNHQKKALTLIRNIRHSIKDFDLIEKSIYSIFSPKGYLKTLEKCPEEHKILKKILNLLIFGD